jgi:putative hemolysin
MVGVQYVPQFAGAMYGPMKNYDSLIHNPDTAFGGYSTVNSAYIDCDANPNSKYCAMNGGQCVKYVVRDCGSGDVRGPTGPTGPRQ